MIQVNEGDSVQLHCNVNNDVPFKKWCHVFRIYNETDARNLTNAIKEDLEDEGKTLEDYCPYYYSSNEHHTDIEENGTYTLRNVRLEGEGYYICIGSTNRYNTEQIEVVGKYNRIPHLLFHGKYTLLS